MRNEIRDRLAVLADNYTLLLRDLLQQSEEVLLGFVDVDDDHQPSLSMMVTLAWPPPSHMVWRP